MEQFIEVAEKMITDVLTAVYSSFWFSAILAILFMFVYRQYSSIKEAAIQWLKWFKKEEKFRRMFFLVFFSTMIIFKTLLNREIWKNPISDVMGDWLIYTDLNGKKIVNIDAIENVLLFIPFTILLFWCYREKFLGAKVKFFVTIWKSAKAAFLFSFIIENLQLFFRLGTWQFSDLLFNTTGGMIGGLFYFVGYKISQFKVRKSKKYQYK